MLVDRIKREVMASMAYNQDKPVSRFEKRIICLW
jgi:hypothetical protein